LPHFPFLPTANLIAAVEVLQNHGLGESQSYSALDRRGTLGSVLVGGTLAAIGAAGSAYLAYRLATQKKEAEDELLLVSDKQVGLSSSTPHESQSFSSCFPQSQNAARNLDDFDLLG